MKVSSVFKMKQSSQALSESSSFGVDWNMSPPVEKEARKKRSNYHRKAKRLQIGDVVSAKVVKRLLDLI